MIAFTSITSDANGYWTFTWAVSVSFRVVLRGVEQTRSSGTSYLYPFPSSEPPPLEIMPVAELADSETYPATLTVQWYTSSADAGYTVSRDSGAGFAPVAAFTEDGFPVKEYTTPAGVADDEVDIKVIATDSIDQQSAAAEFDGVIVTPPEPKPFALTYAAGAISAGAA